MGYTDLTCVQVKCQYLNINITEFVTHQRPNSDQNKPATEFWNCISQGLAIKKYSIH